MDSIQQFIREVHRRSVWQVVGVYVATSWAVLNAVDVLTGFAGLPDWTPTMALVLLLIGFPVVIATAVVQRGLPGRRADGVAGAAAEGDTREPGDVERGESTARDRLFTWRNAIAGGALAGLLLAVTVAAYFVMWSSGIGPMGSLVAQGVLDERDPILLAAFDDRTGEDLGAAVTEALSVDLASSQTVTLIPGDAVRETLGMMGRDAGTPITDDIAREVALRMNVKAFIAGDISRVGTRYLLVGRIVNPESGEDRVGFREEAASEDDLLPAIDRLSQRLREKMGESLREIRLGQPLEQATTSSIDALRKLTQAEQAEEVGDYDTAFRLLEEAIALDSAFAMGHRKVAVLLFNTGASAAEVGEASALAFRYRDRLTDRERYLAEANYYSNVNDDVDAAIAAYEAALRVSPNESAALNNLANLHRSRTEFARAHELLERAAQGPGTSSVAAMNYGRVLLSIGETERAIAAFGEYRERYPNHLFAPWAQLHVSAALGDWDAFHAAAGEVASLNIFTEAVERFRMSAFVREGKLAEGLRVAARSPVVGNRLIYFTAVPHSTGEASLRLWILDDTAGAVSALDRDVAAKLDPLPVDERVTGPAVVVYAQAGAVEKARALLDRWESDLGDHREERADFALGRAAIERAEGRHAEALASIEQAREIVGCIRCAEQQRALVLEGMGRTEEAIEIWERVRDLPLEVESPGWEYIIAIRRLASLNEAVGDTTAAIDAHRALIEAWADGDDLAQPHVERARERIAALGG